MNKLTGAAKARHEKRVLIDRAGAMTAAGQSPLVVAALLVAAEETHPTRNPKPLRPEILDRLLADEMDGFGELTVVRYTGHGLGHTYRDDVPLGAR